MTDYQAEAGRWLDDAAPAVPETRRERWLAINTPALAALLERLCGEKCEEIHPGFAEFRALQKDHRETVAQLAEARAEVAHYSAEAERLDARWTQEHVALVKAEAALEQLRARSCSCICHEDGEAAFERGKEEGKKEAAQLVEERGRKIGGAIDPKLTAQAIRGER